jgi:hypothetical protein
MRTFLNRSLFAFVLATVAAVAAGQQQPAAGCNAAPSCRANGFSVLAGNAGGHVLMSFGVAWDPGFHLGLVPAPTLPSAAEDGNQRFHLRTPPLLPPPALETPPPPAPRLTLPPPDSK